jgi:hypothetical protein
VAAPPRAAAPKDADGDNDGSTRAAAAIAKSTASFSPGKLNVLG